MQYTKQAMDFNCQLNILKERGLTIEDEEEAMNFLHSGSCFFWYTIKIVLQLQRQLCQEEGSKRVSTSTISIFRELD